MVAAPRLANEASAPPEDTERAAARRRWAFARTLALAGLGYAGLAVWWTAPASLRPATTVLDIGDPLHLAWVLAWDAHQLVRRPWALFESNSFHPYPHSLTFGDHLLPEALLAAPVFWATGNAVLTYNVALLTALVLSALAMFVLVRSLTGSGAAAWLAGSYFAFNTFTRSELLRVQVVNLQWWPLAFLFLVRFARYGRMGDAVLLCTFMVVQGLAGSYYLVFTALLAPLWLLVAWWAAGRRPAARELRRLAVAAVVTGLPAALFLSPYVRTLRAMGFEKPPGSGVDALCYLRPHTGSALLGALAHREQCAQAPQFLGYVGLGLVVAGAVLVLARRLRRTEQVAGMLALVTAATAFLLSLGSIMRADGVPLARGPFDILYNMLPLVRGMDGPRRAGVLVFFGGAILLGLGAAWLLRHLRPRWRLAAVAVVAVLLPAEHYGLPRRAFAVPTGADVPTVYDWLLEGAGSEPIVELPLYPEVAKRYWSLYLYFSTRHWRPIPIGRTSFYPPAHDLLAWYLREFPATTTLTLLERLGIRTVVVHPLVWDEHERPLRLAAIEAQPRLRLVRRFPERAAPAFDDLGLGDDRVYLILPDTTAGTPACSPQEEVPREGWRLETAAGGTRVAMPKLPLKARGEESAPPWVTAWAVDGERRTAFRTEDPQRPGDRLEVVMPQPQLVSAAVVELSYPFDEFPRDLVVVGEGEAGGRRRLEVADGVEERWAVLDGLLHRPREARFVIRFPPQTLRRFVLRLGETTEMAWPPWSVPELRLYAACR